MPIGNFKIIEKYLNSYYKEIKNQEEYEKNIKNIYSVISEDNEDYVKKMISILEKDVKNLSLKEKNLIKEYSINFENMEDSNLKKWQTIYAHTFILALLNVFSDRVDIVNNTGKSFDIDGITNEIQIFFKKINIWFNITMQKDEKEKINRKIIIKTIKILLINKIINDNNIMINNKTTKYLSLKKEIYSHRIDIYFEKFKIYKKNNSFLIMTNHFSSILEIFGENLYSKQKFKISTKSEILEKIANYWIFLDTDNFKKINEKFIKEYKIHRNMDEYYIKLLEELKKAIEEKNADKISEISKRMSLTQKAIKFDRIIKMNLENKKIFLPFWFDFRGRLYYGSDLSPTFVPESRYSLYRGVYSEDEIKEKSKSNVVFEEISKYFGEIKKINILKREYENLTNKVKTGIIFILISIAENVKTLIGKEISIDVFIKNGVEIVNNYDKKKFSYDKQIKIEHLINIIEDVKLGIYKKKLISKDATASVFQHLVKFMGAKNEYALKICNLKSLNIWYDTYQFIIDEFKKEIKKEFLTDEEIDAFFNRNSLKKTIMTEKYSCGRKKSLIYFMREIEEKVEKYNIKDNEKKENEIKKIFNKFYTFISKNKFLIKSNANELKNKFKESRVIIFEDESFVDINYFKMGKKEIDGSINKVRYTKKIQFLTNSKDDQKFEQAAAANIIQSYDAYLARLVIKWKMIMSVHDCFIEEWLEIDYLIENINKKMNIKFHNLEAEKDEVFFSIFIVL